VSEGDPPRVLVVGIGNPDRGDDGFGPAVAHRLRRRLLPGVCVLECSGDVLALIDKWAGFSTVIVVDAATMIGRPGRVHRLDLTHHPLPLDFARTSSHTFGIAEAVELARSLSRLPRNLVAYLVEGQWFGIGAPLSPVVSSAVDEVIGRIFAELAQISAASIAEGAAERA
jgi:hydrogenase maturation protease